MYIDILLSSTHRLVEQAVVWVLVLLVGAVVEAVAQRAVVNTPEPAAPVRPRTREPLHVVRRPGALCNTYLFSPQNIYNLGN